MAEIVLHGLAHLHHAGLAGTAMAATTGIIGASVVGDVMSVPAGVA